jgi:hypothetical protein
MQKSLRLAPEAYLQTCAMMDLKYHMETMNSRASLSVESLEHPRAWKPVRCLAYMKTVLSYMHA